MEEIGIDISMQESTGLHAFIGQSVELAVTVCDHAAELCPFFPGAQETIHVGFPDPSAVVGTEEERLDEFRRVRDKIRRFIAECFPCERPKDAGRT
jgi:arsenate reductase